MGNPKSGDRTRGAKRKPRPNAGRPPSFTKSVDRAINSVNTLINLAQQRGIDTKELFAAQRALDYWAVQHSDSEINQK